MDSPSVSHNVIFTFGAIIAEQATESFLLKAVFLHVAINGVLIRVDATAVRTLGGRVTWLGVRGRVDAEDAEGVRVQRGWQQLAVYLLLLGRFHGRILLVENFSEYLKGACWTEKNRNWLIS